MHALVLAGGIPGADDPLSALAAGRPKALLDVAGKPMVQWIIDALDEASRIEAIVLVGLPRDSALTCSKPHDFIPDRGGMVLNVKTGLDAIRTARPGATHALLSSGDIPAITAAMVDWRVGTIEAAGSDLDYSVIDRSLMDRTFPGSGRTFTRLKDMQVCGGDLNGIHVGLGADENLWNALYAARKNAFKQAALVGFDVLLLAAARRLTLTDAERRVSRRLHLKGHVTVSPYAEIGMDVDKPHQLEIMRRFLRARVTA